MEIDGIIRKLIEGSNYAELILQTHRYFLAAENSFPWLIILYRANAGEDLTGEKREFLVTRRYLAEPPGRLRFAMGKLEEEQGF